MSQNALGGERRSFTGESGTPHEQENRARTETERDESHEIHANVVCLTCGTEVVTGVEVEPPAGWRLVDGAMIEGICPDCLQGGAPATRPRRQQEQIEPRTRARSRGLTGDPEQDTAVEQREAEYDESASAVFHDVIEKVAPNADTYWREDDDGSIEYMASVGDSVVSMSEEAILDPDVNAIALFRDRLEEALDEEEFKAHTA